MKNEVATNEDDPLFLLQRYDPSTILTLFQEVGQEVQVRGDKINWKALVKKTATGITNAREYQMVWRYLAYRHPLLDEIEGGAEPLDDESDPEIDIEIILPVIEEASRQAKEIVQAGVDQPPADGFIVPASEHGDKAEQSKLEPGNKETLDQVLDVKGKAPIIEPGLDEAEEGVVGGELRLVGRKRSLDDGADETPVDVKGKTPIVEPELNEAAEGVVGGELRLVGRKRSLDDGADEIPVDVKGKTPIVEPGLDEAAEGVVGGELRLVGRNRSLDDGADETLLDVEAQVDGSPWPSSSSSSSEASSCVSSEKESPPRTAAAMMVVTACPRCQTYVMRSEEAALKCSKCNGDLRLDFLSGSGAAKEAN